jgi:hypothetical protein
MLDPIREHDWIETPYWRWCRKCGAYQKRSEPDGEWGPVEVGCPGTPGAHFALDARASLMGLPARRITGFVALVLSI